MRAQHQKGPAVSAEIPIGYTPKVKIGVVDPPLITESNTNAVNKTERGWRGLEANDKNHSIESLGE